jgi:hypothetical protein
VRHARVFNYAVIKVNATHPVRTGRGGRVVQVLLPLLALVAHTRTCTKTWLWRCGSERACVCACTHAVSAQLVSCVCAQSSRRSPSRTPSPPSLANSTPGPVRQNGRPLSTPAAACSVFVDSVSIVRARASIARPFVLQAWSVARLPLNVYERFHRLAVMWRKSVRTRFAFKLWYWNSYICK